MGAIKKRKWKNLDVLFEYIELKVTVRVPDSDPLLFDYAQRRKYGCKFIYAVLPAGTWTVTILAADCTPYEAAEEYRKIVNKFNGHSNDSNESENEVQTHS